MGTNRFSPPDPMPVHDCAPPPGGKVWCGVCFRRLPHVDLTNVGFSYAYGREQFHGPTINERRERQLTQAKAAGLDPQPVGQRWV